MSYLRSFRILGIYSLMGIYATALTPAVAAVSFQGTTIASGDNASPAVSGGTISGSGAIIFNTNLIGTQLVRNDVASGVIGTNYALSSVYSVNVQTTGSAIVPRGVLPFNICAASSQYVDLVISSHVLYTGASPTNAAPSRNARGYENAIKSRYRITPPEFDPATNSLTADIPIELVGGNVTLYTWSIPNNTNWDWRSQGAVRVSSNTDKSPYPAQGVAAMSTPSLWAQGANQGTVVTYDCQVAGGGIGLSWSLDVPTIVEPVDPEVPLITCEFDMPDIDFGQVSAGTTQEQRQEYFSSVCSDTASVTLKITDTSGKTGPYTFAGGALSVTFPGSGSSSYTFSVPGGVTDTTRVNAVLSGETVSGTYNLPMVVTAEYN